MLRTENNPPLYFLLMRGWTGMVPMDVAWLRVPSALFGALAAWPLFLVARRLGGMRAAVVAVLMLVLNDHHQGLAHELRAYPLFLLLTLVTLWHLVRWGDGHGRARWWWTLCAGALVYTHFFGWLVIGLQAVLILLHTPWRIRAKEWSIPLLVLAVVQLPYAWILAHRTTESIAQGTWLTSPHPEELYNMLWRWSNAPVIAVAGMALVLWTSWRSRPWSLPWRLAMVWTFLPLLGMFVLSQWLPVFLDRYLVFAAPGWCLLMGLGIAMLPKRSGGLLTWVFPVALAATFSPRAGSPHRPGKVVAQVDAWRTAAPCAEVLVVPAWYRLTYRAAQDLDTFGNEPPELLQDHRLHEGQVPCATVLVVDADPPDEASRSLLDHLRQEHLCVDSVEASHKVWVKRFERR